MNQDSEKGDRDGNADRRETGRSSGRRDDNRRNNDDKPFRGTPSRNTRFNRDDDRPRFNRDGDRPQRTDAPDGQRFNRTSDRNDERPRFERGDKPRFERNDRYGDSPRFNRDNQTGGSNERRPPFDRDRRMDRANNDRPRRDTHDRPDRPRFDAERRFPNRPDAPRRNDARDERRSPGSRPFDRNERPDRRDDRDQPRFSRGDNDRPRFSRNAPPRSDASRPRSFDRPRPNDRPERPRFGSNDNPRFKRVGGFNRDADERNRESSNRRDDPRSDFRDKDSRFSAEQRKDSGDRRTGRYDKAPNYNLEQRPYERRDRPERDTGDRRPDKYQSKRPADNRNDEPGLTRLNRYIANSGVCSRREADELIARGDISVNGKVVTEMGHKVKEGDTVKYGTKVLNPERFVYVLLNKPKDYLTTTEDPNERKTVMELVADAGNFRMYPVGRLDRSTTGLLLLTNDGELADKLMHPSNNIRKIYQVELDKPITNEHFEAIQSGLELEDGPIKPDALSIVTPDAQVIGIEIHSGRNRIVRRMFEHFGYEVTKLDRTSYAGLTKKELPRGKWRFLDPKEVVKLKYFNS